MDECRLEVNKGCRTCTINVISPDGVRVVSVPLKPYIVDAIDRASVVLLKEQSYISRKLLAILNNEDELLSNAAKSELLINSHDFRDMLYRSHTSDLELYLVVSYIFSDGSIIEYDTISWTATTPHNVGE